MADVTTRPPWRLSDEEETEFRRRCPVVHDIRADTSNFDMDFGVVARMPDGTWPEIMFRVAGRPVGRYRAHLLAAAAAYFMARHDGKAAS